MIDVSNCDNIFLFFNFFQDLETFLNESEHGVIYFSMGSLLRTSSFTPKVLNAFLNAFARIPQRILWKFENPENPIFKDQKNIKALTWMPQRDIFGKNKSILIE